MGARTICSHGKLGQCVRQKSSVCTAAGSCICELFHTIDGRHPAGRRHAVHGRHSAFTTAVLLQPSPQNSRPHAGQAAAAPRRRPRPTPRLTLAQPRPSRPPPTHARRGPRRHPRVVRRSGTGLSGGRQAGGRARGAGQLLASHSRRCARRRPTWRSAGAATRALTMNMTCETGTMGGRWRQGPWDRCVTAGAGLIAPHCAAASRPPARPPVATAPPPFTCCLWAWRGVGRGQAGRRAGQGRQATVLGGMPPHTAPLARPAGRRGLAHADTRAKHTPGQVHACGGGSRGWGGRGGEVGGHHRADHAAQAVAPRAGAHPPLTHTRARTYTYTPAPPWKGRGRRAGVRRGKWHGRGGAGVGLGCWCGGQAGSGAGATM